MTDGDKLALLNGRLGALGINAPPGGAENLLRYQALLEMWNGRMNLTGDASFGALLDRHLMDSLSPLTVAGLLPEHASVIDVGSGAGLPGIPLAVMRPDLSLTLLDSLQKRVGFLQLVAESLELGNVTAVHARAEDAARDVRYRERFSVAAARAVAPQPVLAELLLPFVRPGGAWLAYKGPTVGEELPSGQAAAGILGGGKLRVIRITLPDLPEHRLCLATGDKLRPTPDRFPRKAGTPAKQPLGIENQE